MVNKRLFRLRPIAIVWIILAHLMAASQVRAQTAPTLHLVDQSIQQALLVDISGEGELIFQTPERQVSALPTNIVRWRQTKSIRTQAAVALTDGSWLCGRLEWLAADRLKISNDWLDLPELPLQQVRAILFQPSPSLAQTLELRTQMLEQTGSADVVWKRQGEPARGVLTGQWKEPTVGGGASRVAWSLALRAGEASAALSDSDIVGITFSPILHPPLPEIQTGTLTLSDGSRIKVRQLTRSADGRVQLQLAGPRTLSSLDAADEFTLGIVSVTAHSQAAVWLSDLQPARYRVLENESSVPWPLGRNRDLFSQRMYEQDLPIEKALVLHAPAQVAYRWDGQHGRLLASLSLWSEATSGARPPQPGSAHCQVLVARGGQLESLFRSERLRPASPPIDIAVDVSDAQLIVLLIESAEGGPWGDHVILRDARIALVR